MIFFISTVWKLISIYYAFHNVIIYSKESYTYIWNFVYVKMVIITYFGQRQNQHKMLKIQQILPKLYRCLVYVVFHNLEPQNAGLINVKRDLH